MVAFDKKKLFFILTQTHTRAELLLPLVNMIKEVCGNKSVLLILLIY